jgi:HAE1 family hydrophobic/amphiphilic exporter-1
MNISRFSIRRPVFVSMVFLVIIILGLVSLSRLPIDLLPDMTYPTLNIYTTYENASPEEVEELISRPVEEAVAAVPGVEEVSSFSIEGRSTVRVTFSWGTDLDVAANDVRDRLDRAIPHLPENADRPVLRKYDPASSPIVILGAYGGVDQMQLRRTIDDRVKYRIERVPGVATVDVWGGLEREIHVDFLGDRVKALGLPLDGIVSSISEGNVNIPGGALDRGHLEVTVRTPGEYRSLADIRDTVVAVRDGAAVELRDIARVEESWAKVTRAVRINGVPGVRLAVLKQSGRNTVEVARGVLGEVEKINRDLPQIRLLAITDSSGYIKRSITNAGSAALYGGALAVLVLLFFLRNVSSTLVIATAIPISAIATFALMYFGGFTLNIMSLGGLALGVGMMVDGAIVVIENIFRLRSQGEAAREAAEKGSEEVANAIVAGTLTTLAVFLPIVFMRGMSGVMFKQLAYIVGFSLLCSLFVALTLVPMLSAKVLRGGGQWSSAKAPLLKAVYGAGERFLAAVDGAYLKLLHYALGHRLKVIAAAALVLAGSLALIPLVGVELMPSADEGEVRVYGEMDVGTRLEVLQDRFKSMEAVAEAEVPEARSIMTRLGPSGWRGGGSHTGHLRIALKPRSERHRSSREIADFLRVRLAGVPGMKIRTRSVQELFALRLISGDNEEKVQIDIRGHDLERADAIAEQVRREVAAVPGVTDVLLSRETGSPEELVLIDRHKAADMGLTVSRIADMVQTALTGKIASYYRDGGDEVPIRVKLKDSERMSLGEVLDLTVTNSKGQPVALKNVVSTAPRTGPMRIDRKNQERVITVSANISGRDAGSVLSDISERLRRVPVPANFSVSFGGEFEEQQKAFRELLLSLLLALALVYMVMASLYESLRHPFVVMFSVPLAAVGVVAALFMTGTTFNVQSYLGCIMLGGIVVNNAILLVDHINLLRRRDGMAVMEAIEEAGRRRLRPIMMTTLTTVVALLPLALGLGEAGEAQAPLARAVVGGLLSSALVTPVLIPVIYSLVEREGGRKGR